MAGSKKKERFCFTHEEADFVRDNKEGRWQQGAQNVILCLVLHYLITPFLPPPYYFEIKV
jgi:hypothetical protein